MIRKQIQVINLGIPIRMNVITVIHQSLLQLPLILLNPSKGNEDD